MYLFVDTTEKMSLGLIDKNFVWVEFVDEDIKAISSQIHKYIFDLLNRNNTDIDSIEALIYCAGPGSYTGMRISEGLSSILSWQGLPVSTFYHFEVPQLCGISSGQWFSKAFKKENFVYKWSGDINSKNLVSELDFSLDTSERSFCKNEKVINKNDQVSFTDDLLKQFPDKIFKFVVDRGECQDIFYYRSLDAEFSKQ